VEIMSCLLRNPVVTIGLTSRKIVSRLLMPHSDEAAKGVLLQEEARSERIVNIVRFCLAFVWTTTSLWSMGSRSLHIIFNLTAGLASMSLAYLVHLRLSRRAYNPLIKYITTTIDMLLVGGLMLAYGLAEGPVFMFKMPAFVNLICALGLVAFRCDLKLVAYGITLALGIFTGLWSWFHLRGGIEYGSRLEHLFGNKLSIGFLTDVVLYTGMFGMLTAVLVMNLRRHMELRMFEVEHATREEERILMATGLAHEIRNPLAGISGFAQLIREAGTADARHVTAILESVRRLNGLVEGFLCHSRPFHISSVDVDVVGLLADFSHRESSLPQGVVLATSCSELILRTDADAVNQILLNLVQNARRFQPPGIPIRLVLEEDTREIRIRVEDDGPGVAPELIPRLFIPFQASSKGGTGLGLSLTRKIARELGGDILYEPGEPGACFILALKRVSDQEDT
jgi:signal transduction histidine kinase